MSDEEERRSQESSDSAGNDTYNGQFNSYLYKKVRILTEKNQLVGYVKCIDPVTGALAIVTRESPSEQFKKLILVMRGGVKEIEVIDSADDEQDFGIRELLATKNQNDCSLTEEEIAAQKLKVMQVLKKNHVPFEELNNGSLKIAYSLTLMAPYTKDDCICSNEMVLDKIQDFLKTIDENDDSVPG